MKKTPLSPDFSHQDLPKKRQKLNVWLLRGGLLGFFVLGISALLTGSYFHSSVVTAQVSTWYIAPNGSDTTGNGTLNKPYQTPAKAVNGASPGDTVLARGGTYQLTSQQGFYPTASPNAHITLRAYPGEHPIFNGSGASGSFFVVFGQYLDFDGLELAYAQGAGFQVFKGKHIRFTNGAIHHSHDFAVFIGTNANNFTDATDILIAGSDLHDNDQVNSTHNPSWPYGVGTAWASYVSFLGNRIHENYGEGLNFNLCDHCYGADNVIYNNYSINLYIGESTNSVAERNFIYNTNDPRFQVPGGSFASGIQLANEQAPHPNNNTIIRNNIVVNTSSGIFFGNYGVGGGAPNTTVVNNVFYQPLGFTPLYVDSAQGHPASFTGSLIANNIFYQTLPNKQVAVFNGQQQGIVFKNNLWYKGDPSQGAGSGDVRVDPQFVNPGGLTAADYKLKAGSLAIDAGATIGTVTTDFSGVTRPQGRAYDIGAYEATTTPPTTTAAPTTVVPTTASATTSAPTTAPATTHAATTPPATTHAPTSAPSTPTPLPASPTGAPTNPATTPATVNPSPVVTPPPTTTPAPTPPAGEGNEPTQSCRLPQWASQVGELPQANLQSLAASSLFYPVWARYDFFAPGLRTYVWGDQPFASAKEAYWQAKASSSPLPVISGGLTLTTTDRQRAVLYWDKSRMELTDASVAGHPENFGSITNGLLSVELITGRLQLGDHQTEVNEGVQCQPARLPVAGDLDDQNGPTYAAMAARLKDAGGVTGAPVVARIDRQGQLSADTSLFATYQVKGAYYEPITAHTIASPFWEFLNSTQSGVWQPGSLLPQRANLFDPYWYVPGLPVTEAYWAKVKVGGVVKDVLIQVFERRVLTYTPSNPPAYRVEWGNVGRHYYQWRYQGLH